MSENKFGYYDPKSGKITEKPPTTPKLTEDKALKNVEIPPEETQILSDWWVINCRHWRRDEAIMKNQLLVDRWWNKYPEDFISDTEKQGYLIKFIQDRLNEIPQQQRSKGNSQINRRAMGR